MPTRLQLLTDEITHCRACPRLVAWRERVAREKRRAYREETYWGRPVPGFGDPRARIVIVGLAPAAHGGNRTGRVFTGDRSGDFLFAAMHRAGLANQPTSIHRDDGLALRDAYVLAPVRCAPPDNMPLPDEVSRCAPFLDREVTLLRDVRVYFALGAIAWKSVLDHAVRTGLVATAPRTKFAHGASVALGDRWLVGSYHVSQQNTQTGRLTPAMMDAALSLALSRAGLAPGPTGG